MTARLGKSALREAGVQSELELLLLNRLDEAGLPRPETQQRIIPGRRFAFDAVYRTERLAIEVQGGIWTAGAHSRGSGVSRDAEKLSLAAAHGWRVIAVTRQQIEDGRAVRWIAAALAWPASTTATAPAVDSVKTPESPVEGHRATKPC
jgi:very-short-patch-repair endonuclease